MEKMLRYLLEKMVFVFLDNILVVSDMFADHTKHLSKVFMVVEQEEKILELGK